MLVTRVTKELGQEIAKTPSRLMAEAIHRFVVDFLTFDSTDEPEMLGPYTDKMKRWREERIEKLANDLDKAVGHGPLT